MLHVCEPAQRIFLIYSVKDRPSPFRVEDAPKPWREEAPLSQPIPKAILKRHLDTKERARKHGFFPDNSGNEPMPVPLR